MTAAKIPRDHGRTKTVIEGAPWREALVDAARDKKMRKGEAILRFVHACAPYGGARFTDIQRFVCEINGFDFDERFVVYRIETRRGRVFSYNVHPRTLEKSGSTWRHEEINGHLVHFTRNIVAVFGKILSKKLGARTNRGYYCTNLCGYVRSSNKGILEAHAHKYVGKWFVDVSVVAKDFDVVCYPKKNCRR